MNHLAHLLLSGPNQNILLGNFITDFLTPAEQRALPSALKEGLLLHLYIDNMVDSNIIFKESIALIRTTQGKYAPVVADIFYDYLLVESWEKYNNISFFAFKSNVYNVLSDYLVWNLPEKINKRIDRMVTGDFLSAYETKDNMPGTFSFLKKRAKFKNEFDHAMTDYITFYDPLQLQFDQVFPMMIEAVEAYGITLQSLKRL